MLCFVEREHNVFPGCAKDTWGKIAGEVHATVPEVHGARARRNSGWEVKL